MDLSLTNPRLQALANQFHKLCRTIISQHQARGTNKGSPFSWAIGYCQAGLGLQTAAGIRSQALYILANLGSWRGPEARQTKQELKDLVEALAPITPAKPTQEWITE